MIYSTGNHDGGTYSMRMDLQMHVLAGTSSGASDSTSSLTTLPAVEDLEEVLLLLRLDRAVRRRVRDAGQHEAVAHLVVVQERAVRLVDGARGHLARAAGARARTARVRHLDAILLGLVEDVHVIRALDLLLAARGDQRDSVHRRRRGARHNARLGDQRGRRVERRREERGNDVEHRDGEELS